MVTIREYPGDAEKRGKEKLKRCGWCGILSFESDLVRRFDGLLVCKDTCNLKPDNAPSQSYVGGKRR